MNTNPIVITGDGSHSVMDTSLQVTYHSLHGAIRESEHVFIRNGLEFVAQSKQNITILEVGFGTGLNALLSYLYAQAHPDVEIDYTGIEKFPLPPETISHLNYCTQLQVEGALGVFHQFHLHRDLSLPGFQFHLFIGDVLDFPVNHSFDLIYFDAFAPSAQPEMWSSAVFEKVKAGMNPGGVLVTFCAQGQFKRTLKSLGFQIEVLPGPPGKREMVRATVKSMNDD